MTQSFFSTRYSNLKRHKSGYYHSHASVCGKLIRKSLKTKSIEIAKIKLDALLKSERVRLEKRPEGEWLFKDLAEVFLSRIVDMKPSAQKYRKETLNSIRETLDKVDDLSPTAFRESMLLEWAGRVRGKFSPSRYNGIVQTLRAVLQIAVEKGLLADNPVRSRKRNSPHGIPFAPVPVIQPELPDASKFKDLLAKLDAVPKRSRGAVFVRFLAYGGMRIGAARLVMPEHIDLKRNEIILPMIKYDKKPVRVPMIKEMRALVEALLADYPGVGPLLPIKSPRKALEEACKDAGLPMLTPHDLRHLFATRCLESGVDVKTVAEWLGHKDGGALLLKRYAHLRDEHSQKMSKRVKF